MVTETNSSPEAAVYPTPDAEKAFLEAAYVGVSWKHEVQQSPEVVAAALALAEQHGLPESHEQPKLSKDEVEAVCSDIEAKCAGLSQDLINKIKAEIRGAAGTAKSASDLRAYGEQIAAAAVANNSGETVQQTMYNEQQYQQLWGKIDEINKKVDKNIDDLHADGLISDEEYKKYNAERARLDAMDIHDPKRIAGEQALNKHLDGLLQHADETATTPEQRRHVKEAQGNVADGAAAIAEAAKMSVVKGNTEVAPDQEANVAREKYADRNILPTQSASSNITVASADASNANLPIIKGAAKPELGRI